MVNPQERVNHMLFGINATSYPLIPPTGGVTALRGYSGPDLEVAMWPPKDFAGTPDGIVRIGSNKPDLAQVVAGALDTQLIAYVKSIPPHNWWAIHHEANNPNEHTDVTAYTAAVAHVGQIAATYNPSIRFGQIFGTYAISSLGQDLRPWIVPNMEFYGIDGYQDDPNQPPEHTFGGAVEAIEDEVGFDAPIGIIETGVHEPLTAADARNWMIASFQYAIDTGMKSYLWYFFSGSHAIQPPPIDLFTEYARQAPQV